MSNHFCSGADELKSWKNAKENFTGENRRFFVAVTDVEGQEVIAGCIAVKPVENEFTNVPSNTYKIVVSIKFNLKTFNIVLMHSTLTNK